MERTKIYLIISKNIKIPKICDSEVNMLIGANAPDVFLQLEAELVSQPYAIKTILERS